MESPTPPPPPEDGQSPPPPPATTNSGSPTDFLKGVVGKRVIVRLISGVDYQGVNLALLQRQPESDHCRVPRCPFVFRWLHEHRVGADGGARQWFCDK